jgi:membrane protein DedA with SNARE-associated domain
VGTAVLLVMLLVQMVVSIVVWGQSPETDGILFFGYLITALLVVPLAGAWAYAELTRWGPAVLAAAAATVAVMVVRMDQIWL